MIDSIGWEEFDDRQKDRRDIDDRQTDRDPAIEIQVMIYDVVRVRRLCTKFQVNTSKINNFTWRGHFGGWVIFFWGGGIGLRSISNHD